MAKMIFKIQSKVTPPKKVAPEPSGSQIEGLGDAVAQPKEKLRGMGDAAALVFEPIKKGLSKIHPAIERKLKNCGCNKRREAWNKAMPFNS